jgi:hypothetical protein
VRTCALLALCLFASVARAQTGTFTGVVTRDTLDHRTPGVEVRLPQLKRSERTDEKGAFRFTDVPPGQYVVTVRAVGFEPLTATVEITSGRVLDVELTLATVPVALDTIRTLSRLYPNVPRALEEFESRRRTSATGQFLTDSALRAREDDALVSVVSKFRGARVVYSGTRTFLAAARGGGSGKPAFSGAGANCLVSVYENGILIYPRATDPPDFGNMRVADYSAIEFYVSPTEAPAQYTPTGSGCGVLLLWKRLRTP